MIFCYGAKINREDMMMSVRNDTTTTIIHPWPTHYHFSPITGESLKDEIVQVRRDSLVETTIPAVDHNGYHYDYSHSYIINKFDI